VSTLLTCPPVLDSDRYARCVEASKRARWEIDSDVIRGRTFDFRRHFLPEGLSRAGRLDFLSPAERRWLGQIQGRTYANMFGLVERFIGAKILERSRDHWLGDQTALEALVRFGDEELKHQALFRRIETMLADEMPEGYAFAAEPNAVAGVVLGASTWAVLALTCHIELFTLVHYRESLAPGVDLCPLFKDVFLHHWKEESQHAVLDELEWTREDRCLDESERDRAVDDLIGLVGAVDAILIAQARSDADYFAKTCGRTLAAKEHEAARAGILDAYRWQYIVSGVLEPRFGQLLGSMITPAQNRRIQDALAPLMGSSVG
jgi:hypothetical protein